MMKLMREMYWDARGTRLSLTDTSNHIGGSHEATPTWQAMSQKIGLFLRFYT